MADKSRQVQRVVRGFAAIADEVTYSGDATPAISIADPTTFPIFPRAHTFRCAAGPFTQETLDSLAKAVAKQMPKCRHIRLRGPDDAVYFLEALKGQLGSGQGGGGDEGVSEKLTVTMDISALDIVEYGIDGLQKWANHDLPAIQEVTIDPADLTVPDSVWQDDFDGWLVGVLVAIIGNPAVSEAATSSFTDGPALSGSAVSVFCAAARAFGDAPYVMRIQDKRVIVERRS